MDGQQEITGPWMRREIHEQPTTLTATLNRYVEGTTFRRDTCESATAWLRRASEIVIAASGSSRHAGMVAELLFEDLSGLAVDVEYASEYCCRPERALKKAAVMVLSQSGETVDTLGALRKAVAAGRQTLAITNVAHSSMARGAGVSVDTEAGVERAIPATKSFTGQLLAVYLLALMAAEVRGEVSRAELERRLAAIQLLPERIERQLTGWDESMQDIAAEYRGAESFLFVGRGVHYPIAREGALKLKESAYVHAEGYPSGELKHGPNALVSATTPLVMIATADRKDRESVERYDKVIRLMAAMRGQGADMLAIANEGDEVVRSMARRTVFVEEADEPLLAIAEVIPLQLFAFHMAVARGINVDEPRNLTKAVLQD